MIVILIAHFVGDFILQSEWMALNKSKRVLPLLAHGLVYSIALAIILQNPIYAGIQGGLHIVVDFFTSKATRWLWEKHETRLFFVVIGLDQLIHQLCLLGLPV